jgi:hypothetical protein
MKLILILSLLLVSASAYADRSGLECRIDLVRQSFTYTNFQFLAEQKDGLPLLRGCKNVDYRDDSLGLRIDSSVYVSLDGKVLVVQDNIKRSVNASLIPGKVRDYAVMAGRLIIATHDHKVLVVARNGSIFEMLNAEGESYQTVREISIDPRTEELVLHREDRLPEVRLSERQVTDRINSPGRYRVVSLF